MVVVAGLALALAGCSPNERESAALAPPGVFTLARLGHGDQVLIPGTSRIASSTLTYSLPEGARQGKPFWYRIRLHYRLTVAKDSGPGTITIWASTNDEAVAAVDFRTRRSAGKLEVVSSSVGLVQGSRRDLRSRLVWEGTFSNFIVHGGVRPGVNRLRFDLQEMGAARAESLTVYDDTAIVVDARGPASIELVPALEDRDIRVGEPFAVTYTIRNTGGVALPAGGELAIAVPPAMRVAGPRSRRLGRVPGGEAATGKFRLVARRAGTHEIKLSASTWGGSPIASLAVRVVG